MTLLAQPAFRPTDVVSADFIELDECFPQASQAGVTVTVNLPMQRTIQAQISEWARSLTGSVEACSDL
ncbi:hypothetical protein ACFSYH_06860 [Populibacterium corticicola]|uniref:Uncharacterized protein n=1 Tax=Populibacterium corticicola TaxID=1812826 RepID=A0ABW5XEX6_9MICO